MLSEPADFTRDTENAFAQAAAGASQDERDLAPYCTPSYVAMEAGASWLKLGALSAAIPVFEDSRTRWSAVDQTRDHALCLARLATAYAAAGEPGQACGIADDLIVIANGLCSTRVANQVTDLRTSLSRWQQDTSVADLLHRLEAFQLH